MENVNVDYIHLKYTFTRQCQFSSILCHTQTSSTVYLNFIPTVLIETNVKLYVEKIGRYVRMTCRPPLITTYITHCNGLPLPLPLKCVT